jgi:hypothetical protein
VVDMIILMIGYLCTTRRSSSSTLRRGSSPLACPTAASVFLGQRPGEYAPYPDPIIDLRNAVLGIVNTGRLKAGSGQPFTGPAAARTTSTASRWATGRLRCTGGIRYTWTRTLAQMRVPPPMTSTSAKSTSASCAQGRGGSLTMPESNPLCGLLHCQHPLDQTSPTCSSSVLGIPLRTD